MRAQRQILDTTAENIANASTPGYRRQRVELASTGPVIPFSTQPASAGGVEVVGITRVADSLLIDRAAREEGALRSATTTASTLGDMEAVFGEPSDTGIAAQLDEYWAAWGALATGPADNGARTQVLTAGATIVSSLRRAAADIVTIGTNATARMSAIATEVNNLTSQVASFNANVASMTPVPPALLDQRDMLAANITRLTGAVTSAGSNGQLNVFIAGTQVVSGIYADTLTASGGTLTSTTTGQVIVMSSGEGAAVAATVSTLVPRYTAALDAVAATLVANVNALHTAGYGADGVSGRTFFEPTGTTAATIALSADVAGQPTRLAAGAPVLPGPTAPGPLDGNQALALSKLTTSTTGADSRYQLMISQLAVEANAATKAETLQTVIAENAQAASDAVSGVSIDEEMVTLIAAQRAFQASSKVISAIDDMLGYLINSVGR